MKRYIVIGILVLMLSGLVAYVLHLERERDDLRTVAQHEQAQVKRWRDKHGRARARVKTLETSRAVLEEFYGEWVDSLAAQLSVERKALQSALSVGSHHQRFITMPVRVVDTLRIRDTAYVAASGFSQRDRWSSVTGRLYGGSDSREGVDLELKYYDSISVVSHLRKKPGIRGLWQARELTSEAINHNPYSSFSQVRHYQRKIKERRWGVGVGVGYGYPVGWSIQIGISRHIIQF